MKQTQNKIYDTRELVDGIEEFDSYLTDEYEVLYQVATGNDYTRTNSEKDQLTQGELESRLDLLAFILARFKEHIYSKINAS
tara:strand:- start:2982 stop:3227 length:246 start_codon:yes stop_codon:yes gene_type:complete